MFESRRAFLAVVAGMAASVAVQAKQNQPTTDGIAPPYPGLNARRTPLPGVGRVDPKAELQANQDTIRKDVARLSQLVAELQKGLSSDDTTKVLSLSVMRKAEAIEKLARQIRDLIRG